MNYNETSHSKLISQYVDYKNGASNSTRLLTTLENFLVTAYEGRVVYNLKYNFPEVYSIVCRLSKDFKQESASCFLENYLEISMAHSKSPYTKLTQILASLSLLSSPVFVELNQELFDCISNIKEMLAITTNAPKSESEVLSRFKNGYSFKTHHTFLPTRKNIVLQILKCKSTSNLQKLLGSAGHKKLVQIASSEGMSASEFARFLIEEHKQKNNVLKYMFENKALQALSCNITGSTVSSKTLVLLSRALQLPQSEIVSLCGRRAQSKKYTHQQIVQELLAYTHDPRTYFSTQKSTAQNNLLLEYKVFFNNPLSIKQAYNSEKLIKKHICDLCKIAQVSPNELFSKLTKLSPNPQPIQRETMPAPAQPPYDVSVDLEKAKLLLQEAYPHGVVENISKNKKIYDLLRKISDHTGKAVSQIIVTELGFSIKNRKSPSKQVQPKPQTKVYVNIPKSIFDDEDEDQK